MPWSLFSECWALSQLFHSPLSLSSRGSLVLFHFLPWVVSSAYLRWLIFLLAILIPACASSSLAMDYYSALKKEILTHATSWMNLEHIMLSEIRQSQKYKYCMIPLTWSIESGQIHRKLKENIVASRGWREGVMGSYCSSRYRVSVFQDEKNSRVGCTALWMFVTWLNCALKHV